MNLNAPLLICFCASLAAATAVAQGNTERFHDFTVVVDYRHAFYQPDEMFVFDGSESSRTEFDPDSLYLIRHEYTFPSRDGRFPVDTTSVYLSAHQRDTLFVLTRQLFELGSLENTGPPIPPPPLIDHGMHPAIYFDLNFRGDRYVRYIRNRHGNNIFLRLDSFLRTAIAN